MAEENAGTLRILIVEDDFMVRQVIRGILEPFGACDVVVNGEEALQAFRIAWRKKQPYDLICMDIMMPVMDGHQALVEIRQVEKSLGIFGKDEVKAIMISALDDARTVVQAYAKGGATSYIVKPIEKERLINEIRDIGLID